MSTITINKNNPNANKIEILVTRLNTVISKLEKLEFEISEFESYKSDFIVCDQKYNCGARLTEAICRDIDTLLEEETKIKETLARLDGFHPLKKKRLVSRLDEISISINNYENKLVELKRSQFKLKASANFAKQQMDKFYDSTQQYGLTITKEYNPLVENINSLTGSRLETLNPNYITKVQRVAIDFNETSAEEME